MKFEINNSKLEQVVFKYLDNKKFIIEETVNGYCFLGDKDDDYTQIRIVKSNMVCGIYHKLFEEIQNFFSLNYYDSIDFFKRYVENTLNIDLFMVIVR